MAEMLESERQMRQRSSAWMLAKDICELIVVRCSKLGKSALKMLTARENVSPPNQRRSVDTVPHHLEAEVRLRLGQVKKPLRNRQGRCHVAAYVRDNPLSIHHRKC